MIFFVIFVAIIVNDDEERRADVKLYIKNQGNNRDEAEEI